MNPANRDRGVLEGLRIGFFTSVNGFGGSEVILADVIEGAWRAGAEIVCWTPPGVPLRQILAGRGVQLQFRDWPPGPAPAEPGSTAPSLPSAARQPAPLPTSAAGKLWRKAVPASVRRLLGFWQEARRFRREIETVNPDLIMINADGSEASAIAGGLWNRHRTLALYNLSVSPVEGGLLDRWADRLMKIP